MRLLQSLFLLIIWLWLWEGHWGFIPPWFIIRNTFFLKGDSIDLHYEGKYERWYVNRRSSQAIQGEHHHHQLHFIHIISEIILTDTSWMTLRDRKMLTWDSLDIDVFISVSCILCLLYFMSFVFTVFCIFGLFTNYLSHTLQDTLISNKPGVARAVLWTLLLLLN